MEDIEKEGMKLVGSLLIASMDRSKNITDSLMKSNIQSAYRDGFEDGILEGRNREAARIRESLGIYQEEPERWTASKGLSMRLKDGFPYNLLTPEDIRD
jgi:hypothetical protein